MTPHSDYDIDVFIDKLCKMNSKSEILGAIRNESDRLGKGVGKFKIVNIILNDYYCDVQGIANYIYGGMFRSKKLFTKCRPLIDKLKDLKD